MMTRKDIWTLALAFVCHHDRPGERYTQNEYDDVHKLAFQLEKLPLERFTVPYGGTA